MWAVSLQRNNKKMNDYKIEKEKIYSLMSDVMLDALVKAEAFIGGGIVSRVFTGRSLVEVDIDVYFRSAKSLADTLYELQGTSNIIFDWTDKSIMIKSDNTVVQFIVIDYFDNAEQIFEKFDFTCVMGILDIKEDKFIFHDEFFHHNSQRKLVFNPNTSFPIISAIRVDKYKKEGYSISKTEFLKILVTIMGLSIHSWQDAEKQFGKFYGVSLSSFITDAVKEEPFSIEKLLEVIGDFEFEYHQPAERNNRSPENFKRFVIEVTGIKPKLVYWREGQFLSKNDYGHWEIVPEADYHLYHDEKIKIDVDTTKIYKYVIKNSDGVLRSQYRSTFIYTVGQNAIDNNNGMWFNYLQGVESMQNTYGYQSNRVMIECEPVRIKNDADFPKDVLTCYEVKVLRELSKEEEKELVEKSKLMDVNLEAEIPF